MHPGLIKFGQSRAHTCVDLVIAKLLWSAWDLASYLLTLQLSGNFFSPKSSFLLNPE